MNENEVIVETAEKVVKSKMPGKAKIGIAIALGVVGLGLGASRLTKRFKKPKTNVVEEKKTEENVVEENK